MAKHLFTSECVTKGHPDKIADQISDAILDGCLLGDRNSRVACETLVTTGQVVVAGEITTKTHLDVQSIVREVIRKVGYTHSDLGFTDSCGVLNAIDRQSNDIALGVDTGGAGDQGIMFGGAVNETPELMPLPISIARSLTNKMSELVDSGDLWWGRPDGKSQVTVQYENGKPLGIDSIVVSIQHDPKISICDLREQVVEAVIRPVLNQYGLNDRIPKMYINPTGRFVIGGPHGDTGVTGRKIVVDTYGGYFNCGGGAFSGKDPSKVDRSGSYMARYIAKNIVASGLAEKCEVQLSYAIGISEPTSVHVNCFDTCTVPSSKIEKAVMSVFDMSPNAIIDRFGLKVFQNYSDLAAYGHFGRPEKDLPWERTDMIQKLLEEI